MRRAYAGSAILAAVLASQPLVVAEPEGGDLPIVVQRFLPTADQGPHAYTAVRRLEARNGRLSEAAWMEVRTEADASGFRYEITGQGGSGYVRERVFLPALDTERAMWGGVAQGAFTPENYIFEDRGAEETGLAWIGVTPRRKDVLLVRGSIFLKPEDGDLVRMEGALAKTPSFWTRQVQVVRRYDRIAGVRVPVAMESVASLRFLGTATFTMSYDYRSVNGVAVDAAIP